MFSFVIFYRYQSGKTIKYLPLLFIDELSNRVKDLLVRAVLITHLNSLTSDYPISDMKCTLQEINSSTTEMPLTISYETIALGKLRFWTHMQDAVLSLQQFGKQNWNCAVSYSFKYPQGLKNETF